jgi:hypothetical protein
MGITKNDVEFLMYCKQKFHIDFTDTAMIGRQNLYLSNAEAEALLLDAGTNANQVESIVADWHSCCENNCYYGEPLLRWFGTESISSFDISDYEGANCIWDLNQPLPEQYWNRYSLVLECGTLEHIFYLPTALRNVMQMTAVGGYLVLSTPGNNWFGHGFYQFSPELFFSVFQKKNGFELLEMAVNGIDGKLRRISSPLMTHRRVEVEHTGMMRTTLRIIARRISEHIPTNLDTQQSDYLLVWNGTEHIEETQPALRTNKNTIETSNDFTFLLEKDQQSCVVLPMMSQREKDTETLSAALKQREKDVKNLEASVAQREVDVKTLKMALAQRETDVKTLETALAQRETDVKTLETALAQRGTDVKTLEAALQQREKDVKVLEDVLVEKNL